MSVWAIHEGDCIDVIRTQGHLRRRPRPRRWIRGRALHGVGRAGDEADYPDWTVAWMREVRRVLCEELVWHKTNPMPMGPTSRPRRAWESLLWYAQHGRPYSDPKANGTAPTGQTAVWKSGQHTRRDDFTHYTDGGKTGSTPLIARSTNVVSLSLHSEGTGHPASYPWQLAEWIAKLTCPPGGTILDPFNGSGSTGVAAIRGGWSYIGIDAVPEYAAMSRARLRSIEVA